MSSPSRGAELAPSIQAACERWSSRPAVTHGERTLTYGELWKQVLALSWALRSLGIERGDRVVCQLPVCPEHFIAPVATWSCGAIHVGAHRDLTAAELVDLVGRTQAKAVVFRPPPGLSDPLAPVRAVRAAFPETIVIVDVAEPERGQHRLSDLLALPPSEEGPPAPEGPEDTALLLMTSGTTGKAKAVMETLPAFWAKMQFFADALSPTPEDVHLMYLPLCHAFGLKLSLMALASGGRLVLMERFSPQAALRLVEDEQVTILPGTPTHLTLLLRALGAEARDVRSLRYAVTAAAPLPPSVIEEIYGRLRVELLYVYGCSEGFVTLTHDRDEVRKGSVGRKVFRGPAGTPPDGTVAVMEPESSRFLPAGEVGEIVFRAARPVRYWTEPDVATDGWYRTGDLGWLDGDGRLFVAGRLKDVVNRGGLKVACGEIERALVRHPHVADCAIVPTPDPILGEAICACVVPADGRSPTLAGVRAHLGATLARHKLPDELCLLQSIPRSPVGKVDRRALTAIVVGGDLPRVRFRPQGVTTATRSG